MKIAGVAQVRDNGCMGGRVVDRMKRYMGWNWVWMEEKSSEAVLRISDLTNWVEGAPFAEIQDSRREAACWGNDEFFSM